MKGLHGTGAIVKSQFADLRQMYLKRQVTGVVTQEPPAIDSPCQVWCDAQIYGLIEHGIGFVSKLTFYELDEATPVPKPIPNLACG